MNETQQKPEKLLDKVLKSHYAKIAMAVFFGLLAYRFLDGILVALFFGCAAAVVHHLLAKHGGFAGVWKKISDEIDLT